MNGLLRAAATAAGLIFAWWGIVLLTAAPSYLLPDPWAVAQALFARRAVLLDGTLTTVAEVAAGMALGTLLGAACGLAIVFSPVLQRWLMPVLLLSQAIPVFALAPLLVLWFGFGMASKIVMAVLVIFFPITAAFADGLRRTDRGWLDLAATMGATNFSVLRHVRLPASLPAFGAGLRIAAAVAPIGAIIGEWIGSSGCLGQIMLNANARGDTPLMFAALLVLAAMTMLLWLSVDQTLRHLLFWAPDTTSPGT
jgi:putative hydroxymethylpyrimidine transport system permease protein